MNCKNYRAYVMNEKKQGKKVLTILAENLQEVKQLLAATKFNVEKVDELNFVTSNDELIASFNVRGITSF